MKYDDLLARPTINLACDLADPKMPPINFMPTTLNAIIDLPFQKIDAIDPVNSINSAPALTYNQIVDHYKAIDHHKALESIAASSFVFLPLTPLSIWDYNKSPQRLTQESRDPKALSELSLRVLKRAKEDYELHGFAKLTMQDQMGNRCALGSLEHAWREENNLPKAVVDFTNADVLTAARGFLNKTSQERYELPIHRVNDWKSREATLECFEFAIKELEASLEPEEKKSIEL